MKEKPKHNINYKKHIYINIFLIILFLIILIVSYLFYLKYNPKTEVNENKNYFYGIENNIVSISTSDKVIETYHCLGECSIYKNYFYKGKILLKDDNKIYLYDLLNNKKLSSNFEEVYFLYDKGKDVSNIKYFVVKDSFNKYGLINEDGTITINIAYNNIGKIENEELTNYSYTNNFIAVKSGESWGLLSLDKAKGVMDFQYQDIIISEFKKLAVKEKDYWYVVDYANKKVLPSSFDTIYLRANDMLVSLNNEAYLTDYTGTIISNKISLNNETMIVNDTKELTIKLNNIIYKYNETSKTFIKE